MSTNLRLVILICGICFDLAIIRLLIKKKFNERASLIWLISAMIVFIVSMFPKTLDVIAKLAGVDYPPSILFLIAILILLLICFYHSVQISMLNAQVKEIAQNIAIGELKRSEGHSFQSHLIEEEKVDENTKKND